MIAKRVHAETFGFKDGDKLIVTGGASANKGIIHYDNIILFVHYYLL